MQAKVVNSGHFPELWKGITDTNRVPRDLIDCRAKTHSFLGDGWSP